MGKLLIVFAIAAVMALAVMSSGYRMDKYLKPIKLFRRSSLSPFLKKFMFIHNKDKRSDILNYSLYLHSYAYCSVFISLLLIVIAAIIQNDNFYFVTAVVIFVFEAIDLILLCFEMIMLTFFAKKTLGDD